MTDPLRRELPEETHALIYELIMSARVYGRLDTHAALAKMEKAKEALCEHIARARAEEREEAAKVAFEKRAPVHFDNGLMRLGYLSAGNDIAAAIRGRGGE